ncbi:DUF6520 family protein [Salegentibacter flavus]|jgi:hypothetical protein|nr:DUF6520 family protein [Salegentibacter flavus]
MKNFKFLMPMLAFVMAIGMSFANKANVQSNGWVERDGVPYQLQNDPCDSGKEDLCMVRFADDPGTVLQVYTDSSLQTPKDGGDTVAYIISD